MSEDKEFLTKQQGYAAMFRFLERYYADYKSDDVGALLGALATMNDGRPMDEAYEEIWNECVEAARAGRIDTGLKMS